jgi:hypothetical protein
LLIFLKNLTTNLSCGINKLNNLPLFLKKCGVNSFSNCFNQLNALDVSTNVDLTNLSCNDNGGNNMMFLKCGVNSTNVQAD